MGFTGDSRPDIRTGGHYMNVVCDLKRGSGSATSRSFRIFSIFNGIKLGMRLLCI